ncbi:hypothetical protein GBAR_LOCUS12277 [Geodia barretti]|uniref:Small integral membrane protein 15 n=1 Tax=Geodia barretti TaxID=519541 RepID=A0AA35S1U7_GEOBA|nr:hypothetical protein GBAR_LOCUS12277 [Geodia barretti]
MEAVKTVAVEWLDWAAKYAAKDPQDFFSRLFLILPLFIVSSVLAFFLLREMNRQEKKNAKKDKIAKRAKNSKKKKQS